MLNQKIDYLVIILINLNIGKEKIDIVYMVKSYANAVKKSYADAVKKSYADAVKTKKKDKHNTKPYSQSFEKLKSKKASSINNSNNNTKLPPKIFLIQGHSSSCFLKDMDKQINDGTIKPIRHLEKAAKKFTKKRKGLLSDAENLRNYNTDKLICHNFISHSDSRKASYFCNECLQDSKAKRYL